VGQEAAPSATAPSTLHFYSIKTVAAVGPPDCAGVWVLGSAADARGNTEAARETGVVGHHHRPYSGGSYHREQVGRKPDAKDKLGWRTVYSATVAGCKGENLDETLPEVTRYGTSFHCSIQNDRTTASKEASGGITSTIFAGPCSVHPRGSHSSPLAETSRQDRFSLARDPLAPGLQRCSS